MRQCANNRLTETTKIELDKTMPDKLNMLKSSSVRTVECAMISYMGQ
jgi:hypothetical protein